MGFKIIQNIANRRKTLAYREFIDRMCFNKLLKVVQDERKTAFLAKSQSLISHINKIAVKQK